MMYRGGSECLDEILFQMFDLRQCGKISVEDLVQMLLNMPQEAIVVDQSIFKMMSNRSSKSNLNTSAYLIMQAPPETEGLRAKRKLLAPSKNGVEFLELTVVQARDVCKQLIAAVTLAETLDQKSFSQMLDLNPIIRSIFLFAPMPKIWTTQLPPAFTEKPLHSFEVKVDPKTHLFKIWLVDSESNQGVDQSTLEVSDYCL